ncbi:NAD(P)/FAD-dependent oxidoreductase [Ponticoccus sp. SC2-23]|uniref:NAD(P)/FAD-dependent oxidoreductase n=1 Tax=Alexandriicola marinus TaxID=2081710 RepID=UPI000FD9CD9A|nr:NAD(P)/FAD-dependent oxidoreductase [Alexandriicola marinus]MBM1219490.1 NAD(P)/FAD-dependent oxidoreductase [Ponticoccus sp. SC6-9]MBM1223438.1 NAD(P)/FAD-dependent oxidoreductase [Ponticoccus sp. SC6-15]MBM1229303.1 NAD(P)/FAD-dependent oxidoreductase [Ponticoccus sp. SC6-38]MBM1232404.1 NAD(P)/FAD-dependent oxidoreductase [Ponticoccus sp. SC6-45]MBM1237646.1 NAD(P)/FAD-dependent oxidoreductase [Ponticoccus sp. SC6-49]MBM1241415.1 NAD(P)/FAD-dependent oxidoreductase [Ponticoccus sp. SC2-
MKLRTLILGAGAAGLFCAAHAGPDTLVIDHARAPGEKIRISGGGRCNFTNLECGPHAFLGRNPHFHKSALSRYTQWDFLDLVGRHGIAWHEKTLGQLFCDDSSRQIVAMLVSEMEQAGARLWLRTELRELTHDGAAFRARLEREGKQIEVEARNLVLATGGKSIPKMGATGLSYDIARQFGLAVTETRPALVPLTFPDRAFADLAGVAAPVRATAGGASFDEALLFSHRGLTGPAILQVSSYWREGEPVEIDLLPDQDLRGLLASARRVSGKRQAATLMSAHLPQRLVDRLSPDLGLTRRAGDLSDAAIDEIASALHRWTLRPNGTEGYRTAEVTLGGIDTDGLSSKTMEARTLPGLYAIGEAVDVTGWLGGYNFQWAWSSGFAAGQAIRG